MLVTFDAATLRDALRLVSKLHPRSSTVPADRLVRLDTPDAGGVVTIRRASFDVDARAYLDSFVPAGEGGSVFVDAKELETAVPKKGVVTLWTDRENVDRLYVDGSGTSVSVRLRDGADAFPELEDAPPFAAVGLEELDSVLTVLAAAGRDADAARPILQAAAIRANGNGTGTVVATDTYRLHGTTLSFVAGEPRDELLVRADALALALKTASYDVGIGRGEGYATLRYTSKKGPKRSPRVVECWTAVRSPEGPFPNYDTLLPDPADAATVWTVLDAAGTADALRRHENRANAPTVFAAAGSAVSVTTKVDGVETVGTVPFQTDGDALPIALNPGYAADAFLHAGDGANVFVRDGLKAVYAENGGTFSLLMPMRVG